MVLTILSKDLVHVSNAYFHSILCTMSYQLTQLTSYLVVYNFILSLVKGVVIGISLNEDGFHTVDDVDIGPVGE